MNEQIRDASLVESKKKLVSGTYLRNAWYVAAWSDDLGDGGVLGRTILKEPVVLYRMANGEVAAIQDRCSHRFAPLSMGKIVGGDRLQCPYHGLEFNAAGQCVLNNNSPWASAVKTAPLCACGIAFANSSVITRKTRSIEVEVLNC